MNSKIIFDYILKLENENNDFKNKNEQLNITLNDLNDELNSLKKVSLMLNFNKQLKEKENTIANLENEIRNIKSKKVETKSVPILETKLKSISDLCTPTIPKHIVETKPESIVETKPKHIVETKPESIVENNSDIGTPNITESIVETRPEPVLETELNEENGKKKKKKPKNCEIIKYKSTEYLLNNDTNEIFELTDKKLSESLGILKNGKVKFYKK
jgi:hypothetical protein